MNWWQEPAQAPCMQSREAAAQRQAQLTKPPGSLGRLEDAALDFAGWQGTVVPNLQRVQVCVFAADHGVVDEGVSAFPQAVTVEMIRNFAAGGAAISVLARQMGATFSVVSLGTVGPAPEHAAVVDASVRPGTRNFCLEPAMSLEEAEVCLSAGRDQVEPTTRLFIGGEMGIGNTTAAAALASKLLELSASDTVGRGTGVDDAGLVTKREAVERALVLHRADCVSPLETLRRLGGLEIAALAGAYIGAAQKGVPSLVDGYICTVAALLACRLNSTVRNWLLFAHRSVEPGHRHVLAALDAEPLVDLGMRLGEGSGAAVVVPLLRAACDLHAQMATFAEAGVSDGEAGV